MDWFEDGKPHGESFRNIGERADVRRIVRDLDLRFREKSGEFWFNCVFPEHVERRPSAHIKHAPGEAYHGVFHCFGCSQSGSIVRFVELVSGKSREEAIKFVSDRLLDSVPIKKKVRPVRKNISLPTELEFYPEKEKWNPPYVEYLEDRRILWEQVVRHRIGYCDEGPYVFRVIVPVRLGGELRSWIARTIRGDKSRILSCPQGKPGLFGSEFAFPKRGPAILCEGWADALAIERAGYQNVMSLQTNSFHISQIDFLSAWKEIILVPDGDEGGQQLINSASLLVSESSVYVATLPLGEDPASLGEKGKEDVIVSAIENVEEWKPRIREWGYQVDTC